jgi:amino acid transporter
MKNFLYGMLLVLVALVGYRVASDYLEDTRDFY